MDGHKYLSGPGKTGPRLINDLLDYDLRYPPRNGRNLLADPAQLFRGAQIVRRGPLDCHHSLVRKNSQTDAPSSSDYKFDGTECFQVGSFCRECLQHITVIASYMDGEKPCELSDEENPLHHFIHIQSQTAEEYAVNHSANKYDQVEQYHRFICSGKKCALQVEILISLPRLPKKLLAPILDSAKVVARGTKEIQSTPERYPGQGPVRPYQALSYLRTYLNDARTGSKVEPPNLRRIAKRNKKYVLAFDEECDGIFEYLGFTSIQEVSPESNDEPAFFWKAPLITKESSNFYDDVMFELEVHQSKRPPAEMQYSTSNTRFIHEPALKDVERSLGYSNCPTRSRSIDLTQEEHPYYASLGITSNFTDEHLSWAYDRQCECDAKNKPYYLDCLEDLATGRQSDDLQTKLAIVTSSGEFGLKALEESYRFFNLDPNTKEGDDYVMGVYRSRIESAPRQKDEARTALLMIGNSRNSEKIKALAADRTMTLGEAFQFLGVPPEAASDSVEAAAVAMAFDMDSAKVAQALRVIANDRGEYSLQKAAASVESGASEYTMDIDEAYTRLQIPNRLASDDVVLQYYKSLSTGAAAGSKDSFDQALRTIAHSRESHFLLRKLEDPDADVKADPGQADQPVGLENIGNTCYLNSLLQYFYIIRSVRELVLNIDEHRMTLSDSDVSNRRAGGRTNTKAEVIKGLKFIEELRNLFENLKTTPSRSIRPTKELAELSFMSDSLEATIRRASVASPNGPPNLASIMNGPIFGPDGPPPPMPTRPSPKTIEEDIEMIDNPGDKNIENASNSSEATLVDMETLDTREENKDKGAEDTVPVTEIRHQSIDSVMVNGGFTDNSGSKPMSPPATPPPIPPRNKSGLVIQTNDISDDTLWRLGTQQDVDEVIRNIMFRMMCAIKPTATDPDTNDQHDQVKDTFYGDNVRYILKQSKTERKVESWSSLLVYAVKNKAISIYDALDDSFDVSYVKIDETMVPSYSSISKLPPILHIQINRTNFDAKTGTAFKVKNEVKVLETIYLDRYMDSEDVESVLMRRRKQGWEWKAELRMLEARLGALKNAPDADSEATLPALRDSENQSADINVADALMSTRDFVRSLQEQEIEGIEVDPNLADMLEDRVNEVGIELDNLSKRIAILKQQLAEQFTDMRQYEYKLQAVFIHRGEAGAGHYWIYIYDFKNDIWREYNDETVSIVKDRKKIFDQQDGSGTPYYLVYVRSSDREDLVEPVCRDVQVEELPELISIEDEGVDMTEVRHVEHFTPRPIRPKPAYSDTVGSWETEGTSEYDANGKRW